MHDALDIIPRQGPEQRPALVPPGLQRHLLDVAPNGVHRLDMLVQLGLQGLDLPGAGACQGAWPPAHPAGVNGRTQIGDALGLHRAV